MILRFNRNERQHGATRQIVFPAMAALLAAALAVAILFSSSTAQSDRVSIEQQKHFVSHVLGSSAQKMAREQEGVTLKDAAVTWLTALPGDERNLAMMDRNFGTFFHQYYGHDESYVLTGEDVPFYAMRDGRRASPASFESIRSVADPVIAALRTRTRRLPPGQALPDGSPGIHDIVIANGHPAILSVKPVISHTGAVFQERGKEILQISVRRLDGSFLHDLSESYLFQNARFAWSDARGDGEAALPFISPRTNRVIGYFIWQPYVPGSVVMGDMIWPLAATLLLIIAIMWLLIRRIWRSTAALQASEAQAKHLAFHDVLTGLPNRALFEDRLDRALATVRRHSDQKMALLYLDLDRFKQVNDTLGHPAGDELIRELASRLARLVRETDTVARLGGDEFAIIQTDITSQRDIKLLCERILAVVSTPFDVVGSQVFVGMSIGVARSGADGLERIELTRKADIALYHAKNQGRGRFAIFATAMDATIQIRQGIERDLRTAFTQGQLELYYQPQYDLATKTVTGVEALLRWNHPKKGMMCPSAFIPVAEEAGLIEPIGEWVLREACSAAARWPVETVSVNVSAVQLRNPLFAKHVLRIVGAADFNPKRLELEITETSFLDCIGQCEANLRTLRTAGIRIALDDFGTGYSSFSHLCSFEIDRVKIDRSFIRDIEGSTSESAIIQAIVKLARATGLKTTAEGVETVAQSDFLSSIGCDELQGFLMSRPVPLDDIDALFSVDPSLRMRTGKLAA
jgi:diguanylate cyclase (GGDEF)-like protein